MTPQSDYDSPWKDVLDLFFEDFMSFFFPQAHAQIHWARGFEFLDKELQKITADAAIGRRVVDKLVKVWLRTGEELWVLIHIEIQGQREADFEMRLFVYNFRIFDRFNAPVATFVILTDEDESWRPHQYRTELMGTEMLFKFPAVKLEDFWEKWGELEQSYSPFAVVAQAQLIARQTRGDAQGRFHRKLWITKRLYERGFSEKEIIGLFRFVDWVLTLPAELDEEYERKLSEYEEEKKMQYVTSIERIGIEKGIEKGILKGGASITLLQLQNLFGMLGQATQSHVLVLPLEQIQELSVALLNFASLSDLEAWLAQHPLPSTPSGASEPANGTALQP
ncbi:MAG: DUF4351 domain-containing protein [Blastocatellia bacterium]